MHTSSMHTRMATSDARRYAGLACSCLVAAPALAALDDITTGTEPDFLAEWVMVWLAAAWFAGGLAWMWKRGSRRRREHREAAPE